MDLKLLHNFLAIAEERSFRKAARRLYVSQPPLTRQMRLLEAELGAILFERKERGAVALTRAGELFVKDARALLSEFEAARRRVSEASRSASHHLTIGNYSLVTVRVLPALMKNLQRAHPEIEVSIVEMGGEEQQRALLKGQLDVGLITDFGMPQIDGLVATELLDLPLVVVFVEGHPLAADTRDPLPISALANEIVVYAATNEAPCYSERLPEVWRQFGFRPRSLKPLKRLESIFGMVSAGHGVAVVPDLFEGLSAAERIAGMSVSHLQSRRLDLPLPPYKIFMLLRREDDHLPVVAFESAVSKTLYAQQSGGEPTL